MHRPRRLPGHYYLLSVPGNKTDPELVVPRLTNGDRFGTANLVVGKRSLVGVGFEHPFTLKVNNTPVGTPELIDYGRRALSLLVLLAGGAGVDRSGG
jgi:hypothetical protein